MRRLALAVLAVAIASSAHRAGAQALTTTTTVYSAVDAFAVKGLQFTVTGVVQGESTSSTRTFQIVQSSAATSYTDAVFQNCSRVAALAMSKPGAYLVEVTPIAGSLTNLNLVGCALSRVTP